MKEMKVDELMHEKLERVNSMLNDRILKLHYLKERSQKGESLNLV